MTKPTMMTASLGYSELVATIEEIEAKKEDLMFRDVEHEILTETLDLEQRVVLALGNAATDTNMVVMAGNLIKALLEEGVVLSVKK